MKCRSYARFVPEARFVLFLILDISAAFLLLCHFSILLCDIPVEQKTNQFKCLALKIMSSLKRRKAAVSMEAKVPLRFIVLVLISGKFNCRRQLCVCLGFPPLFLS